MPTIEDDADMAMAVSSSVHDGCDSARGHQSPVTSHQSPVTSHQSPVASHLVALGWDEERSHKARTSMSETKIRTECSSGRPRAEKLVTKRKGTKKERREWVQNQTKWKGKDLMPNSEMDVIQPSVNICKLVYVFIEPGGRLTGFVIYTCLQCNLQ